MGSGGNSNIQDKLNSMLVAMNHALSTAINIFDNVRHAVTNVYHLENYQVQKQNTNITALNRETQIFTINNFVDCFNHAVLEMAFAPVIPNSGIGTDTLSRWIDHAGYALIENMQLTYVNNEVTSKFPFARWAHSLHRLTRNNRQLANFYEDAMLSNTSDAARNAALMNGHTFYIPVEFGQSRHHFQNCMWISNLSHKLELSVTLAQASDVIDAPLTGTTTPGSSENLSNLSTFLTKFDLHMSGITVDDVARKHVLNKTVSPKGILNKLTMAKQFYVDIPGAAPANGEFEWQINGVNIPTRFISFYIESYYDNVTAWHKRIMHCSGGPLPAPWAGKFGKVDNNGDAILFPTHITMSTSGSNIVDKRNLSIHRFFNHINEHSDREAPDFYIDISNSVKDPSAENKTTGSYDYGVYSSLTIKFTWSGNVAETPAVGAVTGNACRIYAVFHTDNYSHSIKGDISKLLQI